jgi:phenylpyruvate tautomerase PptA (4-oxalocrotonate tautomerase family)
MPHYRVITPKNTLSYAQRQKIALGVTDVHCGISAAPRNFVHTEFIELDEAGSIPDSRGRGVKSFDTKYYIHGRNRAGRTDDTIAQILNGLLEMFCDITGASSNDVSGDIIEGNASWTMEGGHILPEPGEEPTSWYEADKVIAS